MWLYLYKVVQESQESSYFGGKEGVETGIGHIEGFLGQLIRFYFLTWVVVRNMFSL